MLVVFWSDEYKVYEERMDAMASQVFWYLQNPHHISFKLI